MSLSRRARLASRLVAAASCGRRGLCSPAALCPDRSPTPAKPWRGAWWLRGGAAVPYTLSCAGHAPAAAAVAAAAAGAPAPAPPRAPAPAPAPRAPARLLDGRAMAAAWTADVGAAVAAHARRRGAPRRPPGLAVLLVGDHPDSQLYVRRKREACEAAGISFSLVQLGNAAPQASVLRAVRAAVADPEVHGVLVQLPLPPHIDEEAVLEAVGTDKGAAAAGRGERADRAGET